METSAGLTLPQTSRLKRTRQWTWTSMVETAHSLGVALFKDDFEGPKLVIRSDTALTKKNTCTPKQVCRKFDFTQARAISYLMSIIILKRRKLAQGFGTFWEGQCKKQSIQPSVFYDLEQIRHFTVQKIWQHPTETSLMSSSILYNISNRSA